MTDRRLKLTFPERAGQDYTAPYLRLDLPITIQFGYRSQTISDFKDELFNVLEVKEDQLFKLIGLLGNLLAMHEDSRADEIGEYIELLSEFGKAFTEAQSIVREDFEKDNSEFIEKENPKETVLDLSNRVTAEDGCIDPAKQLSSIIHNKKTPEGVRNAIVDSLGEMAQPIEVIDSPEYIAKVLCAEQEG